MNPLFSPITLKGLTLPNRIVIPPMDQYSGADGKPGPWHAMHYGHLAVSGAGLLIVEATAVEAPGRIAPEDLGLWNDAQEAAHKGMLDSIRAYSTMPIGIQLGHAGRKGATSRPWDGGSPLKPDQGSWKLCAPSAIPYAATHQTPETLTGEDLARLVTSFATAAARAVRAGYDAIELHAAHGYLLHEFLSPLSNQREDAYGGSLENRMRFPLEVLAAIRAAVPANFPVGVRVSGTDFVKGGWDVPQCATFAQAVEKAGAAYIHANPRLFRVKFDNQLLVDGELDIVTLRQRLDRTFECRAVCLKPGRAATTGNNFLSFCKHGNFTILFGNFNAIAHTNLQGRNVHLVAVEREDAVPHELTSLVARVGKPKAVHHVVEAAFKNNEQVGTGNALLHFGLLEIAMRFASRRQATSLSFLMNAP